MTKNQSLDYYELLKKYMYHVGAEEGIAFIGPRQRPVYFTPHEWAELQRLDSPDEWWTPDK